MNSVRLIPILMLLFSSFSSAAQQEKENVEVEIKLSFSGKQLQLSTSSLITRSNDTLIVERLRYYISGIKLLMTDGSEYVETNSYHLIDAEEKQSLNFPLNAVPAGNIASITFNIGVDSLASVSGALEGDLDPVKGMYWAWNSGYINLKCEGKCTSNVSEKNTTFEFHIGGYLKPNYALRTITLPLRATKTTGRTIEIESDLSLWLNEMNFKKENSVMGPGKEAMLIADRYSGMFKALVK
jgi:hypothetical protein